MALEVTSRVIQSLGRTQKTPAVVVEFDDVSTLFTSVGVKYYRSLDEGYFLDSGLFLDALAEIINQEKVISFSGGANSTTTKIDWKVEPDLGIGESVSSLKLAMVNDRKNTILSQFNSKDFLGRKVIVRMTPNAPTAQYPRDYNTVFRGIVDEIKHEAGMVVFSVSHPDQKKRQTIFVEHETELVGSIDNSQTTIEVANAAGFYLPIIGPNGSRDSAFVPFVRIEDEVIFYDDIVGNELQDCLRGQLTTSAVSHDDETEVRSFYLLQGNAMDLALKIMLSGWNGPFVEDVVVSSVTSSNELIFENLNVLDKYGLYLGDYVTITGAVNGANNETLVRISAIAYDEDSNTSILTIADVAFVDEDTANIRAAFRSQFDTLPVGLRMSPDEVDVVAHLKLKAFFLSEAVYVIYLKNTIENAKEFLSKEIYQPLAAYSLPKNTRASVGYTIPPLPDEEQLLITLNSDNVKNPEKIAHMRQIGRNFYNSVIIKYNEDVREDAFNSGVFVTDAESRTRIPVGNKVFTIQSKGLRDGALAQNSAQRRLNRYRFAAAQIQGIKTTLGDGYTIDIGDNIYIDGVSLKIPDIDLGTDTFQLKLFQVIQKSLDIKTGDVSLTVLDTSFSLSARYGYISPASFIDSVTSDKEFVIESSFDPAFPEYFKWRGFIGGTIKVFNEDFSVSATGVLSEVLEDNTIKLVNDLSITPSAGMLMEFSDYNDQVLESVKTFYTHITDGSAAFDDGGNPYFMI